MADMYDAAVRVAAGELPSEDLPMIAAHALAEGQDSPTLRELAGLSRSEHRAAWDLLGDVLQELELPGIPEDEQAHWEMARRHAMRIVDRTISPVEGAHGIAWHASSIAFPKTLATFAYLADLWEDNPKERARLEQDLIEEAGNLLRSLAPVQQPSTATNHSARSRPETDPR